MQCNKGLFRIDKIHFKQIEYIEDNIKQGGINDPLVI